MTLHRFFAESGTGDLAAPGVHALPLAPSDVHHLRDVLRLQPNDEIALAAEGRTAIVRLTDVGDEVSGELVEYLPVVPMPRVTLVQGLAKGEKMDQIVRQVTELGVRRVVPFVAERSVVRLEGAKAAARVERWRRIAEEAAKQSQRSDVPEVTSLATVGGLHDVLADSVVLVCWEESHAEGITAALAESAVNADVAVVVGPEGGLTAQEVSIFEGDGARVVSLGDTILRTETAGVVACALAIHARGGLGASHE